MIVPRYILGALKTHYDPTKINFRSAVELNLGRTGEVVGMGELGLHGCNSPLIFFRSFEKRIYSVMPKLLVAVHSSLARILKCPLCDVLTMTLP